MMEMPNMYLLMGSDKNTVIEGEAGYAKQKLWLYTRGKSIADICRLMFTPGITDRVEFHYGSMRTVYEGFNKVESIIVDDEGTVSVRLSGGRLIEEDVVDEGDLAEDGSDGISGGEGSQSGDISPE